MALTLMVGDHARHLVYYGTSLRVPPNIQGTRIVASTYAVDRKNGTVNTTNSPSEGELFSVYSTFVAETAVYRWRSVLQLVLPPFYTISKLTLTYPRLPRIEPIMPQDAYEPTTMTRRRTSLRGNFRSSSAVS